MIGPKETVLDNEFVTIWCYPKEGILHHQFHRYVFGEPFRELLMKGVEAFERYGCTKWLSDDRHFGAILPDDKAWGDTVWRPRILSAGWKYWAMVLPDKTTGKMNIKKLVDEYNGLGIATEVHETAEEALKWLCDQE
jgi:hypothetical protein